MLLHEQMYKVLTATLLTMAFPRNSCTSGSRLHKRRRKPGLGWRRRRRRRGQSGLECWLLQAGFSIYLASRNTIRHHIRVPRIALVLLWLLQVYHRRQLPIKGPPPPAKSSSFAYAYRGGASGDGGGANEGHKLGN